MKIAKSVFLAGLLAFGLACGYSKPATTPPTAGTTPNITQLSPDSATADTNVTLMVTGTNFNSNASVYWSAMAGSAGTQMTSTVTGTTEVMATIPDTALPTAGTYYVTVTNPGNPGGIYGGGTANASSTQVKFTVTSAP
jgi:hypothetical protein